MPKKSDSSKKNNSETQLSQLPIRENDSIQYRKDGSIVLKIVAKPGARNNAITGINEEGIGVRICAPPIDGEANTELIKFLSSILGIRKSDLSLDRGSKCRQKTILIQAGSSTLEKVKDTLEKSINR